MLIVLPWFSLVVQAEDDSQYEKYTREQVEKEQKRIEAERKERIRERLRDREALQWNRRKNKNQAQERMDTGASGSDRHRQFRCSSYPKPFRNHQFKIISARSECRGEHSRHLA